MKFCETIIWLKDNLTVILDTMSIIQIREPQRECELTVCDSAILSHENLDRFEEVFRHANVTSVYLGCSPNEETDGCFERLMQIIQQNPNVTALTVFDYRTMRRLIDAIQRQRFKSIELYGYDVDMIPALIDLTSLAGKEFCLYFWGQIDSNFFDSWFHCVQDHYSNNQGSKSSRARIKLNWASEMHDLRGLTPLDGLARVICKYDCVTTFSMDLKYYVGHLALTLASFLDILEDGGAEKLTDFDITVMNHDNTPIARYIQDEDGNQNDRQDTFETLSTSLSRNTKVKRLSVRTDESSKELMRDCILPSLLRNQVISEVNLWVRATTDSTVEDQLPVWTQICGLLSSRRETLRSLEVKCVTYEDPEDDRTVFERILKTFGERIRDALLGNYCLEKVRLQLEVVEEEAGTEDIIDLVEDAHNITDRNVRMRSMQDKFIPEQLRLQDQRIIRQEFINVHEAYLNNPMNLPVLHALVRTFLPIADRELQLCLCQTVGQH